MIVKEKSAYKLAEILTELWPLLTEEQKSYLEECYTIQRYKKNETIFCENEVPQNLLCLINGKIKIHKNGVGGRSQIIRMIRPIGYFGYSAYFAQRKCITAAAAFEPSTVCLIPLDAIQKVVNENNHLALFFIQLLATDLGIADERTVNLTQKHIRGRLAESLLFLKESYGVEEDESTLSIYLSREDLANLSNMTTSNAIRTLSNFAAERIISIDGRKIKIINEEKLNKISKIG
ncbi:MAG: Crp/Fnr family transcriptional regulator [Bacteroidaceae bacterium]|nr:Crp/Fnr family transcriptional regulator [Bacteroidaceae bacterium]